eukprot:363275-Chlamydomonas_euryale.AAC.5
MQVTTADVGQHVGAVFKDHPHEQPDNKVDTMPAASDKDARGSAIVDIMKAGQSSGQEHTSGQSTKASADATAAGEQTGSDDRGDVSGESGGSNVAEQHEISSGVKAAAAHLDHHSLHLEQQIAKATELLTKAREKAKAEQGGAGADEVDGKDSAQSARAADAAVVTTGSKPQAAEDSSALPDLLAYSKEQGQPGDTIHVLFTSNGEYLITCLCIKRSVWIKCPRGCLCPSGTAWAHSHHAQDGWMVTAALLGWMVTATLLGEWHPAYVNGMHLLLVGSPYQNFQARIMVGTYNIIRKMPGGDKLVAMTRILHRSTPDEVMDEVGMQRGAMYLGVVRYGCNVAYLQQTFAFDLLLSGCVGNVRALCMHVACVLTCSSR